MSYLTYGVLTLFASAASRAAKQPATADAGSQLLLQADATLQQAKTFSADFTSTESYSGQYKDLQLQGKVVLARPQYWRIETKRFRRVQDGEPWAASGNDTLSVSNGKTHFREFIHPLSTQARNEPVKDPGEALADLPLLTGFYGGGLSATASAVHGADPENWEGQSYQVVEFEVSWTSGRTSEARALIGADGIIHRLTYHQETARGSSTREWILRNVKLGEAVNPKTFIYKPHTGNLPLISATKQQLLETGAVAPDFTVFDANGNPVSLSDYAGKTVVLDFWATWCWPCNQSLPFTAKLAERYRSQDVVVLAVAIWDTKASFVDWLKKHNYPSIQFAVDPQLQGEDIASKLYKVSARPTVYIIDKSGHIVTSIVGFDGVTTEDEIGKSIDTALSGKAASGNPFHQGG